MTALRLIDRGSLRDPWARLYHYSKDSTNRSVISAVDAAGTDVDADFHLLVVCP